MFQVLEVVFDSGDDILPYWKVLFYYGGEFPLLGTLLSVVTKLLCYFMAGSFTD
jgi:hypothetical protein